MTEPFACHTSLTLDELEDRLCLLAGRIAAAECEFLLLLADYDMREGWSHWQMQSAAHWLSTRCGMRLGAARERVRVARALTVLPLLREEFAAGRLSYCKVRALTRVATPVTEETLVELARGATGAQLERIVRAWRTVLSEEMAVTRQARRSMRRREADDGSVVYVLRLPPEEAAVVDAAMAAARADACVEDGRPDETAEERRLAAQLSGDPPEFRADADAFVVLATNFLATGAVADKPEVYQVVIHADAEALTSALTLPAVPVETESYSGLPLQRGQSVYECARQRGPAGCTIASGAQLSSSTVMRLLCEASAQAWVRTGGRDPLVLGRTVRHASRRQRRALRLRDGGCRFPGCTRTKHLVPHHVQWWSRFGTTDIDNLVLLCASHHRAVHEVGYTIADLGRGRFLFYRPDGRRVPEPGDAPAAADGSHLPGSGDGWQDDDDGPDAQSIVPTWGGERLDLQLLIGGMAGNVLIDGGYSLLETPSRDLPAALRAAAEWPLEVARRRDAERPAA